MRIQQPPSKREGPYFNVGAIARGTQDHEENVDRRRRIRPRARRVCRAGRRDGTGGRMEVLRRRGPPHPARDDGQPPGQSGRPLFAHAGSSHEEPQPDALPSARLHGAPKGAVQALHAPCGRVSRIPSREQRAPGQTRLHVSGRDLPGQPLSRGHGARGGRQDLFVGGHSVFGLDRLLAEGTPTDGSRSFYTDMLRATLHFDEVRKLDLFALYCNGRNNLRWGNRQSRGRTLTCINLADSNDLDEWGGGAILSDAAFDGHLPFKLYSIFKRSEAHRIGTAVPKDLPAKEVTTLGFLLTPEFDEHWSMEIEAAKQFGRLLDGNRQAGGWMTHLELKYRPDVLRSWKPVVSLASTCYSGDRHRTGPGDNDTAWDPMWARYTLDSEMLVYGSLYGNCYWTNVTYTKLKLAMTFGERHAMYAYTGPMFTAAQDHLGHADGGGDSMYKGWLTAARYDFPIRLAPKGAAGLDRFEVFAHVVAEHFAPGDYFDSSKSAYFARWEIDVRF